MRPRAWMASAAAAASLGLLAAPSSAGAATIIPSTTADELNAGGSCSLREAVQSANTNADTGGCVASGAYATTDSIAMGVGGYTLSLPGNNDDANLTGDLDVLNGNLNFQGSGASITQAGTDDRILDVPAGGPGVALISVTVSGGALLQGSPANLLGGGILDVPAGGPGSP